MIKWFENHHWDASSYPVELMWFKSNMVRGHKNHGNWTRRHWRKPGVSITTYSYWEEYIIYYNKGMCPICCFLWYLIRTVFLGKAKRNETETPTVGLACLALSEWHSNIGLMNEWTPFCQVKGSIEYHLLLYYISSGCLVIKLPWLFSVIFSLILYSDLEERRWRQLISGGKAVANGDVKTV